MALEYGYFDSEITGYDDEGMPEFDRAKTSDFMADFFSKLITSGVLADPSTCFKVTAYDGMQLAVAPGYGFVKGRFAYDEETSYVTLEDSSTGYNRIDMVVLRNNYPNRCCEIVVKTGTPAASPVAPTLLQPDSGDYYELCLALITVKQNATTITDSVITDTRFNSAYCGPVTQLIDHLDTSTFYTQLNAFYEEFVSQANTDYSTYAEELAAYLAALQSSGDAQLQSIVDSLTQYESDSKTEFEEWFETVKGILGEDEAGKLQLEIEELQERCSDLETENTTLKTQLKSALDMILTGKVTAGIMDTDGSGLTTCDGEGIIIGWNLCRCSCG